MSTSARIITPYYGLLVPILLCGCRQEAVVRRRWWRTAAAAVWAGAVLVVVVSPARPLWPAQTVCNGLAARLPHSPVATRTRLLYESYARRWDALAPVRERLPAEARKVGFIWFLSGSTMETSLWRPFGQRKILHAQPTDTADDLARRGIRWVVVATVSPESRRGELRFQDWFQSWLQANGARVAAQVEARTMATGDPATWYIVELAAAPRPALGHAALPERTGGGQRRESVSAAGGG